MLVYLFRKDGCRKKLFFLINLMLDFFKCYTDFRAPKHTCNCIFYVTLSPADTSVSFARQQQGKQTVAGVGVCLSLL